MASASVASAITDGGGVMLWPEFQALMARLGMEIHEDAVKVEIVLEVNQAVRVTEICHLFPKAD